MNKTDLITHQMAKIGRLGGGPEFVRAIDRAKFRGASIEFINDAMLLSRQLAGDPGDGGAACLREVGRDLKATEEFVDEWDSTTPQTYSEVIDLARETIDALRELKATVDSMSPAVLDNALATIRYGRTVLRGRPVRAIPSFSECQRFGLAMIGPVVIAMYGLILGLADLRVAGLFLAVLILSAAALRHKS